MPPREYQTSAFREILPLLEAIKDSASQCDNKPSSNQILLQNSVHSLPVLVSIIDLDQKISLLNQSGIRLHEKFPELEQSTDQEPFAEDLLLYFSTIPEYTPIDSMRTGRPPVWMECKQTLARAFIHKRGLLNISEKLARALEISLEETGNEYADKLSVECQWFERKGPGLEKVREAEELLKQLD